MDQASSALVVIDVQNDFCDRRGLYGRFGYDLSRIPSMAERLGWLIEEPPQFGVLTIFVRATYDDLVLGRALRENYGVLAAAVRDSDELRGSVG